LKKPANLVRFYKQKTKKTEPKQKKKRAKTGKTEPNRFEPVFSLKNRTEPKPVGLTRFWFGFGLVIFLIKIEPN
jgi:hypothetical protein